jgi:AraC family transcriptional regulator of adaptative response / DNA-3-methyladenine glycosylase II
MLQDTTALYNALVARDSRFDGVFYVGVTSTGVYCRPICTARTPKAANCRFFGSAEAAEKASFRPCLRCRPELAPGNAPVDDARRIATLLVQRIDEGMLDGGAGLERIAARFGWSARQIRRIVRRELGVAPIDLVLTRRLLRAKQLLTETELPMTEIASASGFASVRRFNDAFSKRYGLAPTRFRDTTRSNGSAVTREAPLELQLNYRPPFDWAALLQFLGARAARGVELVNGDEYARTVSLGTHWGWLRVANAPNRRTLLVQIAPTLAPVLPALLGRLRNLFDLDAHPDLITEHLMRDRLLRRRVEANPGLRVPGAFDTFELIVRAVLGQLITVKAATTLAGRFVAAFGESIATAHEGLTLLHPTPERVAALAVADIASLGITAMRAETIIALAQQIANGRLTLEAGSQPDVAIKQLVSQRGIGAWTAQYIAMRALRWPDAFPKEDVAVRKALGGVSAAQAEEVSRVWSPWRSYAVMHLWQGAALPR